MTTHAVIGRLGIYVPGKYYVGGVLGCTGFDVASYSKNYIYAMPFFAYAPLTIDQMVIRVTTAKTDGRAVLGIYTTTSRSDLYPESRVVVSDELDCTTTGLKTSDVSYTLAAGQLYWFAYTQKVDSVVIRSGRAAAMWCPAHVPTSLTNWCGYWGVSRTYDGTLPSVFPSGGQLVTVTSSGLFPAVGVRCANA